MSTPIKPNPKIINGKSIIISGNVHDEIIAFVQSRGMKVAHFTEDLFIKYLTEQGHVFGQSSK